MARKPKNRKAIHFPSSQMPLAGLEPARSYPLDFESSASANSATAAWCSVFTEHINHIIQICKLQEKFIFSLLLFYTSPLIMSKQSKVAK